MLYGMIVRIRRMAYQKEWLRQYHLPKPVVSVGNLTVGGTGKTPFVIWLAHQFHKRGKRVAVLTRGYGRQDPSQYLFVSDGQGHIKEWRVSGDEPTMIAQHCPWAIVAVGTDRFRLGQWVLEQTSCDYFILDDGYQHLSLYRDLNVLLFDATDVKGLSALLPAGRLREPLEASVDAEAIVFTRADSSASIQSVRRCLDNNLVHSINPIIVNSVPKQIQHVVTGQVRPLGFLLNLSLLIVSGIGNPCSFRALLTGCGADVCHEMQFPDHCAYGQEEINLIQKHMNEYESTIVMTTEKDAVKLREWFTKDEPVWCLTTDLEFIAGEDYLLQLLDNTGVSE